MMFSKIINKIKNNRLYSSLRDNEDLPILQHIADLNDGRRLSLLEVGSGECRFVKKLRLLYPNIDITCIEINPNLAQIAKDLGLKVINDNILNVLPQKEYDIVHCSHVIEHFGYPQVVKVLDFLVASTKKGGNVIIRTPMPHEKFYDDIDHVRPYPPGAILNYFNLHQQQIQSNASVIVKRLWYRTTAKQINHLKKQSFLFVPLFILRPLYNWMVDRFNDILFSCWRTFRSPATDSTGYVIILEIEYK